MMTKKEWRKVAPKERRDICYSCEYLQTPLNRCKSCGCFVILKAILTNQECPVNKWPIYKIRG